MGSGISQATSQLKTMGSEAQASAGKVKQSGIGIGAGLSLITMNLVNTANSIIGLKRQYEDLTMMQNNVKQSGFALANAQNMLKTATDKLNAAKEGKAGATALEIKMAKEQFVLDMKNAKTTLDKEKAQVKLNKVLNQGGKDQDKINAAQRRVENITRRVASATINNTEAQIKYKRAVQDLYLQIIPTAI